MSMGQRVRTKIEDRGSFPTAEGRMKQAAELPGERVLWFYLPMACSLPTLRVVDHRAAEETRS